MLLYGIILLEGFVIDQKRRVHATYHHITFLVLRDMLLYQVIERCPVSDINYINKVRITIEVSGSESIYCYRF